MPTAFRTWLRAEHGASAISLLAIVATLAIVAAVAIPALTKSRTAATNQGAAATAQAQDAAAPTLLAGAQTAIATYAASGTSGYSGVSPSALQSVEPNLVTSSTTETFLSAASGTPTGYTLVATDPATGDTFTLTSSNGVITRTCAPAGRGGCLASGTF